MLHDRKSLLEARLQAPRADDLQGFVAAVRRYRRSVLALLMCVPALTVLYVVLTPPRFTAWVQISLDPGGHKMMDTEFASTAFGTDMAVADTQVKIISSDLVLGPVVDQFNLERDPEYGPGLFARAAREVSRALGLGKGRAESNPKSEALQELRSRMTVRRTERTYVIDIGVGSRDPARSAALAAAIAESYISDQKRALTTIVRETSRALTSRLDDLRAAVLKAEKAVQAYKARNGMISTRDVLTTEQQLNDLYSQLSAASVRTTEAKARRDAVMAARSARSLSDPAAMSAALNSAALNELRKQAAEVTRTEATLTMSLGPLHPALKDVRQQSRQIDRLIADELRRINDAAQTDYDVARRNEQGLTERIAVLRRETLSANEGLPGLRELEIEAQARRATYEAFLSRAHLSTEQQGLGLSNVRVITPARAPDSQSGPPRSVLVLVSIIAALLLGATQAVLRDRLTPAPSW